ncbi:hypothetical protein C0J52_22264 [Blattella germanica]|nr:hypothetical protein C0J52_22264 [Blattella germanica]
MHRAECRSKSNRKYGERIALYLNLPNSNLYTGHCFRRSSTTLLVDAGGDTTTLKRHGGWKSTTVAEGYIEESIQNKMQISNTILNSVETENTHVNINAPSTMGKRNIDYSRNTSSASLEKANMSDTNSDSDTELMPPEISVKALEVSNNLIPHKSRKMYEKFYRQFMDWRKTKSINSFSENVLLVYFEELSLSMK